MCRCRHHVYAEVLKIYTGKAIAGPPSAEDYATFPHLAS